MDSSTLSDAYIGSDNGLLPHGCHAIARNGAGLL